MRVLLVSGSLPPMRCGVGDYTDALASALASNARNAVAVLTSREAGGSDPQLESRYERFPVIDAWKVEFLPTVRQLFNAWRPDIVHLQYPTQGYRGGVLPALLPMLAWRAGATPVRTWHEAFSGRRSLSFLLQSAPPGPSIVVRPNFVDLMWRPLRPLLKHRVPKLIAGAAAIPRSTLSADRRVVVRRRYLGEQKRLIVFFGFIYPAKGVDQLFDIGDPAADALVIAGEAGADTDYTSRIRALAESDRWAGNATLTGYLEVTDIADLLAVADVVVLPFRHGGGSWNSSISAAIIQGTPVVTTSRERHGIDKTGQIYFARPNDRNDIRTGLSQVRRAAKTPVEVGTEWTQIAAQHEDVYALAMANRRSRSVAA